MSWTEADVPDQSDRVAVVTGANTGIGYDTARVLAQHGAVVVLGCRNQAKAKAAATQIAGRAPGAQVEVLDLDLSDLSSVRAAAETVAATHDRIDLLVNNAGVRMTPYATTPDGFELQFATNHLGHFALTGLLLDRIMAAPRSRIVTVSSNLHRLARIDFDDVQGATNYRPGRACAQSKLANLLFTYETLPGRERSRSARGSAAVMCWAGTPACSGARSTTRRSPTTPPTRPPPHRAARRRGGKGAAAWTAARPTAPRSAAPRPRVARGTSATHLAADQQTSTPPIRHSTNGSM